MNVSAVFNDTKDPVPSGRLWSGSFDTSGAENPHLSSYAHYHGPKVVYHDRRSEIASRPSSLRLLSGTNDRAWDLTGSTLPYHREAWNSETKASYDGRMHQRHVPSAIHRVISNMDNQEAIFGKTNRQLKFRDVNDNQHLALSAFQDRDNYQTTYHKDHRSFSRDEQLAATFWSHERVQRPWLQLNPAITTGTNFKLQHREPTLKDENRIHPTEAQLSTLPHYLQPLLSLEKSEIQTSYQNPFRAPTFYFDETNRRRQDTPDHLQKTFIA
ncbi:uncharacterized protein LOC131890521 [Tigriopus californicus]|uniref:uncharacterized protein LOC131890521 n=1 Tax=Tigriopus californicus TaxID=6832 RepID=UPI0027DA56D1|nr:uncharacterized protein LOC131890521 [Tigriopus californicus]